LSVREGQIFGLLGANGAGKTTTLSMLTRHLVPVAGAAYIKGKSILSDFTKAAVNLGVVTQDNSLWPLLSVTGHLKLFARLRGVPEKELNGLVDAVIDQLELSPHRYKLAGRLSGGMKRKLCVAIALIGDPAVCLLDEPSAGLDPVSRRNLWNVILRTMSHRSVVLTTHSMEEAEALCGRIAIMVKGQVRAVGTKQHLKSTLGAGYELIIKLSPGAANIRKSARRQNSVQHLSLSSQRISSSLSNGLSAQLSNNGEVCNASRGSGTAIEGVDDATELSRMSSLNLESANQFTSLNSLGDDSLTENDAKLKAFVSKLFVDAEIVADNGGLITWRISSHNLSLGVAFREIEAHKVDLHIESYSISQPTLEQVFMRTVQSYDNKTIQDTSEHGYRASFRSDPHTSNRSMSESLQDANADNEAEEVLANIDPDMLPRNQCGCTLVQVRHRVVFAFAGWIIMNLLFVFVIIRSSDIGPSFAALWNFAAIGFLVYVIVMLIIWQCACCKVRGIDDES